MAVKTELDGKGLEPRVLYDTSGVALGTEANPLKVASPAGGSGGAVTEADGANVALGSTTDAAETSDSNGTAIGFLRGLVKWAYERMPASLGQKTKANSFPVALASDDSLVANVGATTDAETETGDGSAISIFKRLRTLLAAVTSASVGFLKVEFAYVISPVYTADQVVKSGSGYLKRLRFSGSDAVPTAGSIKVYDGTDATGTLIDHIEIAAAYFVPFERTYDGSFATGLFLDFSTTADVYVGATYR